MNIFFHTEPLSNGHHVRGIGSYTRALMRALELQRDVSIIDQTRTPPDVLVVDVIHYPYFDLFQHTLMVHDEIPTVVTIHDVIPLRFPNHFPAGIRGTIYKWIQTRKLAHVAAVLTDSESSKHDVMKYLHVPGYKIHVVRLGVSHGFTKRPSDKKAHERLEKRYQIQGRYMLYVGDVNWNKNIPGLLHAFARIKSNRHSGISDLQLVMVGSAFVTPGVREVKHIHALIGRLGLRDHVRMPGFVHEADLAALYHGAFVYVQPSYYEGFGLPVVEAMASGVPVVSTNGGSLSELSEGIAELVHPDPDGIYAGILSVASYSPSHRRSVIHQGIEFSKQFSWKQTAIDTLAVYKQVAHVITP